MIVGLILLVVSSTGGGGVLLGAGPGSSLAVSLDGERVGVEIVPSSILDELVLAELDPAELVLGDVRGLASFWFLLVVPVCLGGPV